jgi:hypothetical protein
MEGGEKAMMRDYVLWNLREAADALGTLITEIEGDPEYDQGQLEVDLNHVYHHINTAWNARNASPERIETCSAEDFHGWRQFPTDIDMKV